MRHQLTRHLLALVAITSPGAAGLLAQSQPPPGALTTVRRLSVDEAVRLSLEQNLGIQIERLNPQIQDLSLIHI